MALGAATASNSFAFASGYLTVASGVRSAAMGHGTTASGGASTALGENTTASGAGSLATGDSNTAAGNFSFVGGRSSSALGDYSLAFGQAAEAGGVGSVALGQNARTTAEGSFMFSDRSSPNVFQSNLPNEFGARFAGGFYLYTNAALSKGVALAANGSSWADLSDVNAKENFRDVDGEVLLTKLARIPIREWNYKAQDTAIRHMGPTAQDFRAAFGLGDFPLRINTIDADGVALAGVKALDTRTSALRATVDDLRRENADLRARLARLEAVLDGK